MPGGTLDETRRFQPVNIAVLTVSDSRTLATDRSGAVLAELIEAEMLNVSALIRSGCAWVDMKATGVDVVISTGGTGLTGRDLTPEAFQRLYDREIPGFGELFRFLSYESIGASSLQSRATAGVARGTYLFALPGSTGAVRDAWNGILVHQLDSRFQPCNLVALMPRLQES